MTRITFLDGIETKRGFGKALGKRSDWPHEYHSWVRKVFGSKTRQQLEGAIRLQPDFDTYDTHMRWRLEAFSVNIRTK